MSAAVIGWNIRAVLRRNGTRLLMAMLPDTVFAAHQIRAATSILVICAQPTFDIMSLSR